MSFLRASSDSGGAQLQLGGFELRVNSYRHFLLQATCPRSLLTPGVPSTWAECYQSYIMPNQLVQPLCLMNSGSGTLPRSVQHDGDSEGSVYPLQHHHLFCTTIDSTTPGLHIDPALSLLHVDSALSLLQHQGLHTEPAPTFLHHHCCTLLVYHLCCTSILHITPAPDPSATQLMYTHRCPSGSCMHSWTFTVGHHLCTLTAGQPYVQPC